MYTGSGTALAWEGTSYPAPPGLLAGLQPGRVTFRAVSERQLSRLYALLASPDAVLVSEVTLDSRLAPHLRDLVLPVLAGDSAVNLKLQDFGEEATGFDDHLARHGDRYTGGTAGEHKLLFVALRAPDRTFLGYARLRGLGLSEMARGVRQEHLRAAAGIIVILFTALTLSVLAPWRRPWESAASPLAPTLMRLLSGIVVVWTGRAILSWFPLSLHLAGVDLFDSSLFATAGLFHLMRSPGDLLLTTAALLVTAVAANRTCGRLVTAAGDARPSILAAAGAAGLALLVAGCIWLSPGLAEEMIGNSSMNLLSVQLLSPDAPTLVMQAAILAALLSVFLLAQGLILLAGSAGGPLARLAQLSPRPGQGVSRWIVASFLPCAILAGLSYDTLLVRPSRLAIESLFENVLMPEVAGQHEARVASLRATMESLASMPDLADSFYAEDRTGASIALDLWFNTPLAGSGYNASLIVRDRQGRILSRFARNLPPAFDSRAEETAGLAPDQVGLEHASFLDISKNILHAHHNVMLEGHLVGSVTVHILDEFDNVPFLTPESPYVRALAPDTRRIVGLPSATGGVRHTVYAPDSTAIFSNQREVPPLPRGYTDLLVSPGTTIWANTFEEGSPARTLFFSDGRHLFALGFALPTPLERTARSIRMVILALILLGAGLLPVAAMQTRGRLRGLWPRLVTALGRTHYRRLLTTFSAVTLIPLLALSILMSEYVDREIDRDVEDRGRQGIQSAGSLVRTILETDEDTTLVDDTLYWLSLLVGEDVNFYEHGEITATSRRELFSSGLLSPRLSGAVYRTIVVDGKRFAMGRQTLREFEYRTITAPVTAGDSRRRGLLSLPLDAQAAQAVRQAREVGDAMLITFVSMIFLMGIVGYVLARRVSRPIRSLSVAAARIAGGDLDATVEGRPGDETGELIASFNAMACAIKEQREDLERRKDYIEKILLNATIGVISMDRAGTVVTTNPAASTLLGLPHLAPGSRLGTMLAGTAGLEPLARVLEREEPPPARDIELTPPGEAPQRTVRARAVPFLDGAGIILLLEDVTETIRSNRLAAWAEMARRIAHEIKNPLTPIQLSAEHIGRVHRERDPEFPVVLEQCLGTIMNEVAKLRQISGEFSTYARIPTPRREPTPMTGLILGVARPYGLAMPPGIALELDVPEGLPTLEVDRSLLGRALVNLIENALQAMPRGGTLSLSVAQTDETLTVEIADTGVGMDAEARSRILRALLLHQGHRHGAGPGHRPQGDRGARRPD